MTTPQTLQPRSFLPLTPAVFHVLLSLSDAIRHGYGISKDVERRTGGEVKLGPGTLYGTLGRLVTSGLVREAPTQAADAAGAGAAGSAGSEDEHGRRRYYELTPLGREVVGAEAQRLEQLVGMAREKAVLTSRT